MKSTGIVRKIDNLGRLVLPVELRRGLGLDEDPTVEIFVEEDTIVLKKYQPACLFCGEAKNVTPYMGRNICANCRAAIAEQMNMDDFNAYIAAGAEDYVTTIDRRAARYYSPLKVYLG